MEHSSAYTEFAMMIEKDWLVRSIVEVDQLLNNLEQEGRISAEERVSLWELYVLKFKMAS